MKATLTPMIVASIAAVALTGSALSQPQSQSAEPTIVAASPTTVARELKGIWVPIDKKAPLQAVPPADWTKYEKTTGTVRSSAVHIITTSDIGSTVAALTGPVGVTFANGHDLLRIDPGTVVIFGVDGVTTTKTLAQVIREAKATGSKAMADNLLKAVEYFSETVAKHTILNDQDVVKTLIVLVRVASGANPPEAHVYVTVAVDGVMRNPTLADTPVGRNVVTALVIGAVDAVGKGSKEAGAILSAASAASKGTFSVWTLDYAVKTYGPQSGKQTDPLPNVSPGS